jgi:hypothetical protein
VAIQGSNGASDRKVIHCDSPYKLYEDTQWIHGASDRVCVCVPNGGQLVLAGVQARGRDGVLLSLPFRAGAVSIGHMYSIAIQTQYMYCTFGLFVLVR